MLLNRLVARGKAAQAGKHLSAKTQKQTLWSFPQLESHRADKEESVFLHCPNEKKAQAFTKRFDYRVSPKFVFPVHPFVAVRAILPESESTAN